MELQNIPCNNRIGYLRTVPKIESQLTTFMVDLQDCIIIMKNVPSRVCSQCGEVSYDSGVAKRLEVLAGAVKANAAAEIAVVNYESRVA